MRQTETAKSAPNCRWSELNAVKGNTLFVVNFGFGVPGAGTVGEYDAKMGSTINGKFIKGLTFPSGVAIKAAK